MNTVKFSCPSCGQHIEADASVAKTGVHCPACQTGFVPIAKWQPRKIPVEYISFVVAVLMIVAAVVFLEDIATPILWFALGAGIGGLIGRKRGRVYSGIVWGFLLGPLGWLVLYALPNLGPKCPECLAPIDRAARKCRHCGSEITAALVK